MVPKRVAGWETTYRIIRLRANNERHVDHKRGRALGKWHRVEPHIECDQIVMSCGFHNCVPAKLDRDMLTHRVYLSIAAAVQGLYHDRQRIFTNCRQVAEYSAGLITTNVLCLWPLF